MQQCYLHRPHCLEIIKYYYYEKHTKAEDAGFEPANGCQAVVPLAEGWFKPLTQSSNFGNNIFTNLIAYVNQSILLT